MLKFLCPSPHPERSAILGYMGYVQGHRGEDIHTTPAWPSRTCPPYSARMRSSSKHGSTGTEQRCTRARCQYRAEMHPARVPCHCQARHSGTPLRRAAATAAASGGMLQYQEAGSPGAPTRGHTGAYLQRCARESSICRDALEHWTRCMRRARLQPRHVHQNSALLCAHVLRVASSRAAPAAA